MSEPKRKRVLIVEDTDSVQLMIKLWLASEGFEIDLASDGREAMKRVETTVPDLILLDVMMPGANGFEVCRQLRKNEPTKNTPIIIITALAAAQDPEQGKLSGANEVIVKPLEKEVLVRRIRSYLGSVFKQPE